MAAGADLGRDIGMKTLPAIAILKTKLLLDQTNVISSWMCWISEQMGVSCRCSPFGVFAQKPEGFLW